MGFSEIIGWPVGPRLGLASHFEILGSLLPMIEVRRKPFSG